MVTRPTTIPDEYATTEEAARLLGVSRVTVLRWIKRGILEAYTFGPRRLLLKRSDLANVVRRPGATGDLEAPTGLRSKMTPEEAALTRSLLSEGRAIAARIHQATKGGPLKPTWELLNELRDERAAELDP